MVYGCLDDPGCVSWVQLGDVGCFFVFAKFLCTAMGINKAPHTQIVSPYR